MRMAPKPLGKATYVASDSDKEWLQSVQRKLYTQSWGVAGPSLLREGHLRRARCTTKGARRVRWGACGDLPGVTRVRRRTPTLLAQ